MTRPPADLPPAHLRPALPTDVDALVALAQAVWPVAYASSPGAAQHTLDTWWTSEATATSLEATTWVVAERDGLVVGAGNLDRTRDPAVIWKLLVHPDEQGLGTGTALLDGLAALAGHHGVRLSYLEGNEPAARFYAARGFVEVGRTPADGADPAEVVVERR